MMRVKRVRFANSSRKIAVPIPSGNATSPQMAQTQTEPINGARIPASDGLRDAKLVMNFHDSVPQPCQKIEISSTANTIIAMLVAIRQISKNARFEKMREAVERGVAISRTPHEIGARCTGRSW